VTTKSYQNVTTSMSIFDRRALLTQDRGTNNMETKWH